MARRTVLVALALVLVATAAAQTPHPEPTPTPAPAPTPTPPPQTEPLPAPDSPLPRTAGGLAITATATTDRLLAAIDRWRAEGDPSVGGPPRDVELLALHHQRIVRLLTERPRLHKRVLGRMRGGTRSQLRNLVASRRALASIHSVVRQKPRVRLGPAEPADVLRRHYRRAWRRFGVGWPLLAAVNHVESAFGRLRNESVSGARGPMQFMPATWAAYGLGGNVRDPRDAILGAANYLHANGAPGDEARALYHYNPSLHYVRAVRRIAHAIRADERVYYALYSWQVYYRGRWRTAPSTAPSAGG